MGTFAGFYGNQEIKEELKQEYIDNVKKLIKFGGMMQFEKVNLFDKEIALLKTPEANDRNIISFHYNYFGDEAWETAGFNLDEARFYSNKIGWAEFNIIVLAVYVLTEFYTKEFGMAEVNGEIFDAKDIIGWINYILDADFTNIRGVDAFKIMETCPDLYRENNIAEIVTGVDEQQAVNLSSLCSYFYLKRKDNNYWDMIDKHDKEDTENENITLPKLIRKTNLYIEKLQTAGKTYEDLLNILLNYETIKDELDKESDEYGFCIMILFLNHRQVLIQLCEIYEKDFFEEYKLYKDKLFTEVDKLWAGDTSILKPIEKVRTCEYLDMPDSSLCFLRTEAKENYHISDDDFAYFYGDMKDLEFSQDFNNWCKDLKSDFDNIRKSSIMPGISAEMFIKDLIDTLEDANDKYKRIFAFKEMFYDFLANMNNINYHVALILFKKVIEDNIKEGEKINNIGSWDIADRNLTFNKGRLNVKRFLSIMANRELRYKIFNF